MNICIESNTQLTLFLISLLVAGATTTYWNVTNGMKEWRSGLAGFNWRWQVSKDEKPAAFYLLMLRRMLGVIGGVTLLILGLLVVGLQFTGCV